MGNRSKDDAVAWFWRCNIPPTAHPLLMKHGNGSPKISLTLTVKEGYDPDWNRTVDKEETVDLEAHKAETVCYKTKIDKTETKHLTCRLPWQILKKRRIFYVRR
jgi:hypothetical protein